MLESFIPFLNPTSTLEPYSSSAKCDSYLHGSHRQLEPEDHWLSKHHSYLLKFDSPILQVSKNVIAYKTTNSEDH